MLNLMNISPADFWRKLQGKKLFLFGAGRACEHFHEVFCHYYKVEGIIDNNSSLWNKIIDCNGQQVLVLSVKSFLNTVSKMLLEDVILLITPVFYGLKIVAQLDAVKELDGLACCLGSFLRYYPVRHGEISFTEAKQKIPKKIHYCWFGGSAIPEHLQKFINGWKRLCPDYEIIEWNESNYDVCKNQYMKEAYEAKKWGFVPDYARVDIIYEHGGIYLDTDVELLRRPDKLLNDSAFFGFCSNDAVALGVGFGAVPKHPLLKSLRDFYDDKSFLTNSGGLNLAPCYVYQHPVFRQYGFKIENEYQKINDAVLYPSDVFGNTGAAVLDCTVAKHHSQLSWVQSDEKKMFDKTIQAVFDGRRMTFDDNVMQ